ncbi:type VI secretion system Vgr family protein [Paracoccus zhejiangensis]|uniref:Type VI secretion system tip protein VgrG n=1 Tax=Paracoccus zhejiangensis TaxID=1077935 RepID=A0A2H5F4A7_9RHOB|nr:type VI secretion system tip protein TssI/VgrG [Paracoccus zhejiangensis]AUH66383.1 type VI secretion system tip protein VgrG [Paracoccus zhejiangensis]
MNAPFKQTERLGRLTTALGADTLSLLRFDGSDHLNDLFDYRVEALAIRDDLDFDALIGTHASVEIEAHDQMRAFDGIVTSARWAGVGENGHRYDLTLRPWFWLAGRRRNQRIFHDKTAVQILQELFGEYAGLGDPALEMKLTRDYPVLEYTVQYRESDLDFARRQMERAGISFHFRHAVGSHTLVLTDDALSHETIGDRPFKRYDGHHHYEQEHFWDWAPERNLTTGAIRLTDYNFKTPTAAMETDRTGDATHPQGRIESFDYPGDYLAQPVGKLVAGLRTEQERGADRRNRAVGDCVALGAGMRLTLSGDTVPGTGESYLCLSASHHFVSEAYGSGGPGSDGYAFTGSYTLMPDTAPMVPPRRTPPAIVQGPQTAMVVGEGEIDCDEYGRILVRFHWDLTGAHSMRCRVSQNWAGAGWGGMVIPRIGMEVVVEFLEGDPDKPLVTGCVYNGKNGVPYELPKHKTVSTFKTDTHQGAGYNELRFEDERGEEEIFVHAQKDMNIQVLNNREKRVDVNEFESIGANKSAEIGNNLSVKVGGNYSIVVGANKALDFISNVHQSFTGFLGEKAKKLGVPGFINLGKGNYNELIGMNKSEVVALAKQEAVGLTKTTTIGRNSQQFVGHNKHTFVAGSAMHEAAKTSTMVAGETWQVACGSGAIVIHSSGKIEIKGSAIDIVADTTVRVNGKDVKIN